MGLKTWNKTNQNLSKNRKWTPKQITKQNILTDVLIKTSTRWIYLYNDGLELDSL